MREDSRIPIILRRPFLATERAMIDVFNMKITLRVGDDEVTFDIDQSIKILHAEDDECYRIDNLDEIIHLEAQELLEDDQMDSILVSNLEKCIIQSNPDSDDSKEPIRHITQDDMAYLKTQEVQGVQDVVKDEIVKLLDSGLIYLILNSPWVNPIHVVPKKGGMIIVLNDNNELIPSRTVTGWHVYNDYRKLNDVSSKFQSHQKIKKKRRSHIPMELLLTEGCCLDYAMLQRLFKDALTAIFHDMVKDFMEVFMDDFSIFGNSFKQCLNNLDKMLSGSE
uniref:Reverse transcriptase domain-containing protein n=1 Tax=Tanacetum cinerariifolium TaxID=118510 RepID=A0A699I7P7_TANCI|nr:reverse transcriptase domain-containing protein [Tanacetum cinerariifolium]